MNNKLIKIRKKIQLFFNTLKDNNDNYKIEINEKVYTIILNIKQIDNIEIRKKLTIKLENILQELKNINVSLEIINPKEEYILLQDKNILKTNIIKELDELIDELNNLIKTDDKVKKI